MKLFVIAIVLMVSVSPLAHGQQPPKPTGAAGTGNVAEKYEAVTNPIELGLDAHVAVTRMEFGNDAGGPVNGTITSITIGGKELALTSNEIVDGHWITTKDYGKIKIASGALGRGFIIYLTPSQRARLLKLYKETMSSK